MYQEKCKENRKDNFVNLHDNFPNVRGNQKCQDVNVTNLQ